MRRFLTGFAAAAIIAAVPTLALANNQEVAEQIANSLRSSGQMSGYKIGVKYQDGTAWLSGRVTDQEQMNAALRVVFRTPEVARVVNELTIASSEAGSPEASQASKPSCRLGTEENKPQSPEGTPSGYNPLRSKDAAAAGEKPQRDSLAKRLESVMARGSERDAAQPLPMREEAHSRADRLASWFVGTSVKPTSAEESEAMPEQAPVPQRAKPVPQAARKVAKAAVAKVAMVQPNGPCPAGPNAGPMPMYATAAGGGGVAPARYDQPCMPNYAWPSYASYPNYAGVTYPKQYSPTAWPYIGPFYPYPQVPLGWRKVTLEWDDGWWFLDFKDQPASCWHR